MAATRLLCHGAPPQALFKSWEGNLKARNANALQCLHLHGRISLKASTWSLKPQLLRPRASEQGHRLRRLAQSVVIAHTRYRRMTGEYSIVVVILLASTSPRHCCSSGLGCRSRSSKRSVFFYQNPLCHARQSFFRLPDI